MTAPRQLRTIRLVLRSFEHGDIPAIVRLAGAREISATTAHVPHPYADTDALSFLAQANDDFCAGRSVSFAITSLPRGELCGAIALTMRASPGAEQEMTIAPPKRAELGYWIGVPYWGQGFATEAANAVIAFGFETLRLNEIYAHHFAGNIASQRVLEKIGMRHEGPSRLHIAKWNKFLDVENYALPASEFRSEKTSS